VPSNTEVAALRDALDSERKHLRAHINALEAGTDTSLSFDENFADSGQVAAEQGEAKVLVASLTDQLADVERALNKIGDGAYGRCEVCGNEIASPRLEAMPATRYCIDHA
jgi:RNA polymerase-binding transcription factor DksA